MLVDSGTTKGLCAELHKRLGEVQKAKPILAATAGGTITSDEEVCFRFVPNDVLNVELDADKIKEMTCFYATPAPLAEPDFSFLDDPPQTAEEIRQNMTVPGQQQQQQQQQPNIPQQQPPQQQQPNIPQQQPQQQQQQPQLSPPKAPRKTEWDVHQVAHYPARTDCEICVWAKKRSAAHRQGGMDLDKQKFTEYGSCVSLDWKVVTDIDSSST